MKPISFAPIESESGHMDGGASFHPENHPKADPIRNKIFGEAIKIATEFIPELPKPDLIEAKMQSFASIVSAIPEGKLKGFVAGLQPGAEVDAKIHQGVVRAKDFAFGIVKRVLAKEISLVGAMPDHIFEHAAVIQTKVNEKINLARINVLKNEVRIVKHGASTALDVVKNIVSWIKGPPKAPVPVIVS